MVKKDGTHAFEKRLDDRFDFHKHKIVQLGRSLMSYSEGAPGNLVTKYTNPDDSSRM